MASHRDSIADGSDQELVEVAFTGDLAEAEMIRGLLEASGVVSILQQVGVDGLQLGYGLLTPGSGSQRVMVRAEQAQEAEAVLAAAMAEGGEEAWPEIANAEHLADAHGRNPRGYGTVGAFTRIFLWTVGAWAVVVAIFLLLRAA